MTKGQQTTQFEYEMQGLRLYKATGSNKTRYAYNNDGLVISEANAANQAVANYVWGPDRLIEKRDASSNKKYYYMYNGHGDVVQIIDENGTVVNKYQYDEWGNILQQEEKVPNSFKYAGELQDEETGLYYLRARYYDPSIGRFISKDTYEGDVSNPLSQNQYTYVENAPLNNVDPTGNWCESADGKYAHPGGCDDGKTGKKRFSGKGYSEDRDHDGDYIVVKGNDTVKYDHQKALDRDGVREDNGIGGIVFDTAVTLGFGMVESALKNLFSATVKSAAPSLMFKGGLAGEAYLQSLVGATLKSQLQVSFETSLGIRRVDVLVKKVAYESKVGFVKFSQATIRQIQKDAELLGRDLIKRAEWHFFRSEITGLIGADSRILKMLSDNGIKYVIHK
ncbi:tRNA(Glu)-specific nuclease WapA precursor [compost metagenome]